MTLTDFLTWLLTSTGAVLVVLGVIGYMFREKWKQILTRSMNTELEKLKHQLFLEQAEHAASLTPQLESIKHDFQLKLEAYKNSLIAQAEEAKLRGDVRKSIATRYVETQFERLMAFEKSFSRYATNLLTVVQFPEHIRAQQQITTAVQYFDEAQACHGECEMYLTIEELQVLATEMQVLTRGLEYVGPGRELLPTEHEVWQRLVKAKFSCDKILRGKLQEQAKL